MAGTSTEGSGVGKPYEEVSSGQQKQLFQSGEALVECRSLEQVENGSPSTSPPYWDSDDYDIDRGPKPADLYGKHTWKIDNFSQTNKRELRSIAFEVGGYKWYILIYPQGCDVSNHLSLFLCVAEHDKLLPGWNHFAQFTIAVVNKDPNKSKYSDTLHKFCKKEHDWGWKKFMELSKVLDGFIEDDALIIKAQVQVIRERVDRPFRCLECQYRRELVRVYLTNVEQICRRFIEERKAKLRTLIEDKARWSSFRAFWVEEGHSSKLQMSSEKKDSILKVAVKLFFIEKEVTSTLVMESLYSGLKALEGQNKGNKSKGKCLEAEELPEPIVRVEKDKFSLVDDVLLLLERAAVEPLPPKDDKKGPQNRTKDGSAGEEFNKDSMERDERRLTELGRRTIEIFALAHIFSKIDTAYKEAVSLKKQEELIREEEASCLAVLEQKARRGQADKEKKSKKKQGKQKRNNRKGKDKGDRIIITVQDKIEEESPAERNELASDPETVLEKSEAAEYASDVSDSVDCASEILHPESEDRDLSPVNWDTDTSDVHHPIESDSRISGVSSVQNGKERSSSVVDDASSTCSSDSVPSVVSVANKGTSPYHKNKKSPSRGTGHQSRLISESADWVNEEPSRPVLDPMRSNDASHDSVLPLQDRAANGVEQQPEKKILFPVVQNEEAGPNRGKVAVNKIVPLIADPKIIVRRPSDIPNQAADNSSVPLSKSAESPAKLKPVNPSQPTEETAHLRSVKLDKSSIPYMPVMSRPLSAPLVPGPRPAASMVSMVPMEPVLARSVSAAGRLGPEPTTTYANRSYVPQSYRNAIIGAPGPGPLPVPGYSQNHSGSSMVNASSHPYSHAPLPSLFTPGLADRTNHSPVRPNFGMMSHHESPQNGPGPRPVWNNNVQQSYDLHNPGHSRPYDEFPHLDIINDLLDDEHGVGMGNSVYQSYGNGPRDLNRYYSFPSDPAVLGGPSPVCRFDRARRYHEGILQRGYGVGDMNMIPPNVGLRPSVDGMLPNQWQMSGSDASYLSLRSLGSDGGYPYHIPEYNGGGIDGYAGYRPSNGH